MILNTPKHNINNLKLNQSKLKVLGYTETRIDRLTVLHEKEIRA